jgi:allantoicase
MGAMDTLLLDLASHRSGGRLLEASNEALSPASRLLEDGPPAPPPAGQRRRDAWETRRRRGDPGHDWAIVRLGMRAMVRRVVVDTTHAGGDRPAACSLEAIDLPGTPSIVELVRDPQRWETVVPRTALAEGATRFDVPSRAPVTHVRLVIYPDGAVARLRCLGDPVPPDSVLGQLADLAAVGSGGRVIDCSDPGVTSPNRMLGAPGRPPEGWLTGRRRAPGFEWAVVRLGGTAAIERIELDTSGFEGEAPGAVAVRGILQPGADPDALRAAAWRTVVDEAPVREGARLKVGDLLDAGPFSHLRLDLHPDGGVRRFSAFGVADGPWTDALSVP